MLYFTMSEAVRGNPASASQYGTKTVLYALGMAAGISIVWSVRGYIMSHLRLHRRAKAPNPKK